ncbi:MAG: hypothetical protein AAF495_12310 [Pseudomonadota bacterium]
MVKRIDLIGKHKNPLFDRDEDVVSRRTRKPRKELSLGRACLGFLLVLALNGAFFAFHGLTSPGVFDLVIFGHEASPETCAVAWQRLGLCRTLNLLPFLIMPGLVLVYLVGRVARSVQTR